MKATHRDNEASVLELAESIRRTGTILPSDLSRVADSPLPAAVTGTGGDSDEPRRVARLVEQTIRLSLHLLGAVLSSVRTLTLVAGGLALANTALVVVAGRERSLLWFGAAFGLLVLLTPALALNRLGKRFASFRGAVSTICTALPGIRSVPTQLADEMTEIARLTEESATKSVPVRVLARARILLRLQRVVGQLASTHRDLLGATATVGSYGPQDVVLATYGVIGICLLCVAFPTLLLVAVVTLVA